MLALRKSYPDGCLPIIKSTGLHAFNNVMIFKVPEELRKPGETKYQLATLDPTKDDTPWPADEYVKKLYPNYPMKERRQEKRNEDKDSVVLKKSTVEKESKTKDSTRNEFRYNKDKKYYQKHTKRTLVRHSYSQRPYYKQQKPLLRDNRRYYSSKPPNAADNIDPWLRPAISGTIIAPPLIINQPSADAIFLRPEPNVIHPPSVPFYNQSFSSNNTHNQSFNSNNTHNRSFNSNNNTHGQSFNGNTTLPASNVYVKLKKCVGLLGDRPKKNASFDNSYGEYNAADNSFDDDNNYAEYSGADTSFDDYPSYQSYDPDGNNWNDKRPGGWNDNFQNFTQNMYQGNHVHGGNPTLVKNVNFPESRGWKGIRSMRNRGTGDQDVGIRGIGIRGTGDRGIGIRGTGDRGIGIRGTGNRGPINRGTMNRRAMNRGTMNRTRTRGTGNRGAFHENRRGRW